MRTLRIAMILCAPVCAFADDTGKGAFPISSAWLKSVSQLYTPVQAGSDETAIKDVMTDWLFQPAPPSTDLQDPVGRGVVPLER